MTLSLNEVDAMAKRAARGAGYPWGLAEEAGKATRWLCAQSLDGVSTLAATLDQHDPSSCPLTTGCDFCDKAAELVTGPVTLSNVRHPLMLLAFAASVARQIDQTISLTCDGAVAVTDGVGLSLTGTFPDVAHTVHIRCGGQVGAPLIHATRAIPDPDAWATLDRLAHRTYAPATEESRRLGAGAGLSDND